MDSVTVRELRNHGGLVLDRVAAGETLAVTRDGRPVAELRPLAKPVVDTETLIARRRTLPPMDPDLLRADIDAVLDMQL
jgi:prevent-host-death family protein